MSLIHIAYNGLLLVLLPSFGAPLLVVLAEEDAHFATALADDIINPMCYDHSRNYLQAYFKEEQWALKKFCSVFFKIIEFELDDGTETTYNLIKEQDGD